VPIEELNSLRIASDGKKHFYHDYKSKSLTQHDFEVNLRIVISEMI